LIRNTAGQAIDVEMITTAGAAFTGTVTVYITGDSGTQTIGSVGGGVCTHKGNGLHQYLPSQAETAYDLIAFTFTGAGAVPQTISVPTITTTQAAALALSSGGTLLTYTGLDLCTQALNELMIYQPGEALSYEDAEFLRSKLTRLLDNFNAERTSVFADTFTSFTITPNLQPHTIGPSSATWTATQRPVSIDGANLIITGNIYLPIAIRDAKWRQQQTVPLLTSQYPTDLYYEPAWPNGSVYLYPVPTNAYSVQLLMRTIIAQMALSDVVSFPPGYLDAIILNLAVAAASGFEKTPSDTLLREARDAKVRMQANNAPVPPRLLTADAGLGGTRGDGTYYDGWLR
jgi:hypothetical protein